MIAAARAVGCRTIVSAPHELPAPLEDLLGAIDDATESWAGGLEWLEESDAELADAVRTGLSGRVRFSRPDRVPAEVRHAKAAAMLYLADEPLTYRGRTRPVVVRPGTERQPLVPPLRQPGRPGGGRAERAGLETNQE